MATTLIINASVISYMGNDVLRIVHHKVNESKIGKVSTHSTTSKGKNYVRGKIYLPNSKFTGKEYRLLEVKGIEYTDFMGEKHKGKGYVIFFPE